MRARGDSAPLLDDPLIHCFGGKQLVLAYVSRQALMDYFRIPGDRRITLQRWNVVIDRNLETFESIIEEKFVRDEWEVYNAWGAKLSATADYAGRYAARRRATHRQSARS